MSKIDIKQINPISVDDIEGFEPGTSITTNGISQSTWETNTKSDIYLANSTKRGYKKADLKPQANLERPYVYINNDKNLIGRTFPYVESLMEIFYYDYTLHVKVSNDGNLGQIYLYWPIDGTGVNWKTVPIFNVKINENNTYTILEVLEEMVYINEVPIMYGSIVDYLPDLISFEYQMVEDTKNKVSVDSEYLYKQLKESKIFPNHIKMHELEVGDNLRGKTIYFDTTMQPKGRFALDFADEVDLQPHTALDWSEGYGFFDPTGESTGIQVFVLGSYDTWEIIEDFVGEDENWRRTYLVGSYTFPDDKNYILKDGVWIWNREEVQEANITLSDTHGYVPGDRKINGISLSKDRTGDELLLTPMKHSVNAVDNPIDAYKYGEANRTYVGHSRASSMQRVKDWVGAYTLEFLISEINGNTISLKSYYNHLDTVFYSKDESALIISDKPEDFPDTPTILLKSLSYKSRADILQELHSVATTKIWRRVLVWIGPEDGRFEDTPWTEVTESGTKIQVNGEDVKTFNADTKADKEYVDNAIQEAIIDAWEGEY